MVSSNESLTTAFDVARDLLDDGLLLRASEVRDFSFVRCLAATLGELAAPSVDLSPADAAVSFAVCRPAAFLGLAFLGPRCLGLDVSHPGLMLCHRSPEQPAGSRAVMDALTRSRSK
mmetsp:Transcript_54814/g.101403  ORF Transcript_54814/g.101403 Transcript_54814/m.101403 type:complete len:117 (+) Transcript_54814:293-643(+)